MLPEALLQFSVVGNQLFPHYLQDHDRPWLERLIAEYYRHVGKPFGELKDHLKRGLPFQVPPAKRGLNRVFGRETPSAIAPRVLRQNLFAVMATDPLSRELGLRRVAESFGLTPAEIEMCLFADLPDERSLREPAEAVSSSELMLRSNHLMIQGFLTRSHELRFTILGSAHRVIRQAKLRGLICEVVRGTRQDDVSVVVSGPLSLFQKTLMYGRKLSELLPFLAWSHGFSATASCLVRGGHQKISFLSGDPIFPNVPPKEFDSRVEEMFSKRFLKVAPQWDLIHCPAPVEAEGTLIFPDFLIQNREDPDNKWWLEIVGFWTPEYLEKKLRRLRAAKLERLILCLSENLNCGNDTLPRGCRVVWFKRAIEPMNVLYIIENNN
ncbi:MAG: DUF790 family protein [Deltaproteobacteria bacterium]|nr:DUF790 family protein [Deltaproteobacteria bacterium]